MSARIVQVLVLSTYDFFIKICPDHATKSDWLQLHVSEKTGTTNARNTMTINNT